MVNGLSCAGWGVFHLTPPPGLILCPFQKFAFIPFCELSHISGLSLFCHSKTFVHIADRSLKIRLDIPRKSSGGAVICCDLLRCPVLLLVGYWYRCRFNHAVDCLTKKYTANIARCCTFIASESAFILPFFNGVGA